MPAARSPLSTARALGRSILSRLSQSLYGVEAGVVPVAGGNAIDINASPSDAIVLRGLTLNGSGIGLNGINFNSGASLTITNCVVQNFVHTAGPGTGNGILIEPTSGPMNFAITNTIISNNGEIGIFYIPASNSVGNGVIDHVVATGNIYGVNIEAPLNGPKGFVAISNSVFSNNVQDGIFDENGVLSIDNVTISGNSNAGIQAVGTTQVLLGRSVIAGNVTGILTDPLSTFTYKDNRINLNGTDVSGTLDTQFVLQ